ncbi:MAG: cytochrome c [Planctomycetes bacterium]|nr:cytochrome c [Planctomycetota bacterium]
MRLRSIGILLAAASLAILWPALACQAPLTKPELKLDTKSGEPVGLHSYKRWSDKIAQGAEPEGEAAFANLAALGIKNILSVDGTPTEVELAAKYGLRYVHVPIGYDGITDSEALQIVKAVEDTEGPIYVHCHHGLHRGPAAAMLARRALEGLSAEQAAADMKASGTSPRYAGLYRDVQNFAKPSDSALAACPMPPALRAPKGMVQSMVKINRSWDFVLQGGSAKWGKLADHPDIDLAHEVGMIENVLRGLHEAEQKKATPDSKLVTLFGEAQQASVELESAIRAGQVDASDQAFKRLKASCDACHADYRN